MGLQTFLANILVFLNNIVVPLLIAVAFVIFLFNAVRYFILGGSNEDDQEKARSLAFWGIAAFVIMVSFWGIINLLVVSLGFGANRAIIPDYICKKMGGSCQTTSVNGTSGPGGVFNGVVPFMTDQEADEAARLNEQTTTAGREWDYIDEETTPPGGYTRENIDPQTNTQPVQNNFESPTDIDNRPADLETRYLYSREVPAGGTAPQESLIGDPEVTKTYSGEGGSETPTLGD